MAFSSSSFHIYVSLRNICLKIFKAFQCLISNSLALSFNSLRETGFPVLVSVVSVIRRIMNFAGCHLMGLSLQGTSF